jgi:hypothetical protein
VATEADLRCMTGVTLAIGYVASRLLGSEFLACGALCHPWAAVWRSSIISTGRRIETESKVNTPPPKSIILKISFHFLLNDHLVLSQRSLRSLSLEVIKATGP